MGGGARCLTALLAAAVLIGGCAATPARHAVPHAQIVAWVDAGDFLRAQAAIERAIDDPRLSPAEVDAIAFERERMRRIALDFPLTRDEVLSRLRQEIPDLREEEFAAWDRPTRLESLDIDGERRYFAHAVPNLFRVDAAAAARRRPDAPRGREGPMEALNAHHVEIVDSARAQGATSVAPRRVRVTQQLIVNADAVPDGSLLRAWIPYPREIAGQQQAIELLASEPVRASIAPASTLQRTVYLEKAARAGEATAFSIQYEVTIHGRHHSLVPGNAVPAVEVPALRGFLAERPPHIVFTPALRAFSQRVVGAETDPVQIARRLFAAVDAIPWGSAREYSTISNISDYALHQGHADCGQQTLLLIALLRLNGIPARWQSGMVFSDDGSYDNLHDWGQLYLAPWGWVPMDVTTGRLASDDETLRWFYLGSLDAYRIAFNDDYSTALVPPKRHPRSETVDSQRGEVEWDGGNLYFDQWDYRFDAIVVPEARRGFE